MKILSIGNSFSADAQRYLHRLAKKDGVNLKTVNLLIPGCSLRTHYLNTLEDSLAYNFQFNGEDTGLKTTMKQALMSDEWDVITLQQASHFSAKYETYSPYIERLAEYVKKYCPHSKIYIHQTWAYEDGSDKLFNTAGYVKAEEMFADIRSAYDRAAKSIDADGIIPSGEAMLLASNLGIEKVHRDTFHASFGAGRYLLALIWYKSLTGADISENDFNDFDKPVTDDERACVIKAVNTVLA